MELALSENIRRYRRERKLTQEQLAEVLGVTAGAVYKWESALSVPELGLLVELADFFDTSVDALLGYRMKDNGIAAVCRRLKAYCRTRDREALAEAEKALKKYPNSFRVVHYCAGVYSVFGAGSRDRAMLLRALELFEQSRLLIGQNTDPEVSELTLYGEMAGTYLLLGEHDKGLELLKAHNAGGIFSDTIGSCLAMELGRPEEAEPWLAEALLQSTVSLLNAVAGYVFLFCAREEYAAAKRLLGIWLDFVHGMMEEKITDFMVKTTAILHILLAHVQLSLGEAAEARASAEKAARIAGEFDAAPNYSMDSISVTGKQEGVFVYDTLGVTAAESVETMIRLLKSEGLSALWKEVRVHE